MSNLNSSATSTTLGTLIHDYPGSPIRFAWPVILCGLAMIGLIASLVQGSGIGLIFWLAVGGGGLAIYFFQRDLHAQTFEHGFVITRGGKTTESRWEDIDKVTHWVTKWRLYFVIPVSSSHHFSITLKDGRRVKVTSSFQNEVELGQMIQRMWMQAAAASGSQIS